MADQTMDTPVRSLDSSHGRALALTTFALAAIVGALAPRPADAQIVRIGASNPLVGMAIRGNAAGYDPIHGAYLMVGGNPVVQGVCVNASGMPVSGVITIMGNAGLFGSFPRVKFSPQSPDGAGGAGAFLVSWVQTDAPGATAVHARLVSCAPSMLNAITADVLVSDYQQGGAYYDVGGSAIAYSTNEPAFSHRLQDALRRDSGAVRGYRRQSHRRGHADRESRRRPVPGRGLESGDGRVRHQLQRL